MKKLTLIISALALVLGMSQCAKKPNCPIYNVTTHQQDVTFEVNGGGSKGDFQQDMYKNLNYIWDANDLIYVYATTSPDGVYDETHATYCGTLQLIEGSETNEATFKGSINLPDDVKKLRFYHYGQSLSTTDGSMTVDFSTQTGSLTDVANKVVAVCEKDANTENCYDDCKLDVQFAIARIDLSKLTTTQNVRMINVYSTGFSIDKYGNITLNTTDEVNLGSNNLSDYYLVAMKETPDTHHTFIADGLTRYANFISAMNNDKYYRNDDGSAKKIDLLPERTLPAAFSIDGVHKVHFSDGNLAYNSTKNPTWFMFANQWDYMNTWGVGVDIDHFYWTQDCYGTNAKYVKDDGYGFMEWGAIYCTHVGLGSEMWNTLTKDEWQYVISRMNSTSVKKNALVTINGVYGLVILPDRCDLNPAEITTQAQLIDCMGVFLPAAGYREYIDDEVKFSQQGTHGLSWSQSQVDETRSYSMDFDADGGGAYIWSNTRKDAGCCVRLVSKK